MILLIRCFRICCVAVLILSKTSSIAQKNPATNKKTSVKQVANNKSNISSKKTEDAVVYDTTYKGWKQLVPGRIESNSLIADKKGNIYSIIVPENINRKEDYKVSKLVDNKWVSIQGIYKEPVYKIWFTKKDSLVMFTIDNYYFLTENGWVKTIKNIDSEAYNNQDSFSLKDYPPLPDIIVKANVLPYALGQLYVIGYRDDGLRLIYEYVNNKWKQIAKFDYTGMGFSEPIVVKNKIYTSAILKDSTQKYVDCLALFDNTPVIIAKKTYPNKPISVVGIDPNMDNVIAIRKAVGIFEVNGKKGIRNNYGETIIHPVFESITIEPSNSIMPDKEKSDIAYHLIGNNMDFYSQANVFTNPDLLKGFAVTKIKCSVCNGKGKTEDKTIKEPIREWVPEKSTSSTSYKYERVWNPNSNSYNDVKTPVTTSKTEKGYYKDVGYKEKIVPGEKCNSCKAGITDFGRNEFSFDKSLQKYFMRTVTEPIIEQKKTTWDGKPLKPTILKSGN